MKNQSATVVSESPDLTSAEMLWHSFKWAVHDANSENWNNIIKSGPKVVHSDVREW